MQEHKANSQIRSRATLQQEFVALRTQVAKCAPDFDKACSHLWKREVDRDCPLSLFPLEEQVLSLLMIARGIEGIDPRYAERLVRCYDRIVPSIFLLWGSVDP